MRPSRIYRSTINFKPRIRNRSYEIRTFLCFVRKKKFRKFISLYFPHPIENTSRFFRRKFQQDFSRKRYSKVYLTPRIGLRAG